MQRLLPVDTAVTVLVNVVTLTDDTDFKTRETSVAYNASGMDLVWNFETVAGVITQTAVTPTTGGDYDWTHVGDGIYKIEIPASGGASINNDTEGYGFFSGIATGVLPWTGPTYTFAPAAVVNSLVGGTDNLQVDTVQIEGSDATNQIRDAVVDDATRIDASALNTATGTTIPAILDDTDLIDDGTSGLAKIATDVAAILVDTAVIGVAGAGLTEAGGTGDHLTALATAAALQTVDDEIAAIDGNVDLILEDTGTTLPATLTTIAAYLDTEIAAILADTNELQGDLTDGGRLDLLIDAIKAVTDALPDSGALSSLATAAELAKVPKSDGTATWNATALASINSEADTALTDYDPPTRTELTSDINSILTKLLKYVQLLARKDAAIATDNSTELTAINADGGSGAGAFANTTDSTEAIRDRGDAAWVTASGFSTHSASDVWDVGTRVLTAGTNLNIPTAGDNADAVWEEAIGDHSGTAGSTAEQLAAAGAAGDPWATALPGAYTSGQAGKIVGDNLNATVSSRATQTSVDDVPNNAEFTAALGDVPTAGENADAVRTELATELGRLDAAVTTRSSHSAADVWAVATRILTANTNLNDPTAAAIADAILDEAMSGHTTAGTLGKAIADILEDTDELQGDWADGGRLDLLVDAIIAELAKVPKDGETHRYTNTDTSATADVSIEAAP